MASKPDELLYVAYKQLILSNLQSGFLSQHISEADYYIFDKYPDLFLEVLDESFKKHSTYGMVEKFYELNVNRKKDIPLAKEIFKRLRDYKDFKVLSETFGEKVFAEDIPLVKEVVTKIGGDIIIHHFYGFEGLKINEKLRENLYNLDNFSFTWFNLPAPNDDNLIKFILQKDPKSYTVLSQEQCGVFDYALLALQSCKNTNFANDIYSHIPLELRDCKDISLEASKKGVLKQPATAFAHKESMYELLKTISSNKQGNRNSLLLEELNSIDINAFQNPKNIEVLLDWLSENKDMIKHKHETYCNVYKILKSVSKFNSYVREQFNKNGSIWNIGNIGSTKYESDSTFRNYFHNNVPQMQEEMKHYVMAYELSNSLKNKSEQKQKRMKI